MPIESIGVRFQRIATPHDDVCRNLPTVIVVLPGMHLSKVGNEGVTHERVHGRQAWCITGIAGKKAATCIGSLEADKSQKRQLPRGITSGTEQAKDGLGAEFVPYPAHVLFHDVVCLVPSDALPLVLTTFAHALQGSGDAGFVVHGFGQGKAAHAQTPILHRAVRVAFHFLQLAVFDIIQNTASLMTSGSRPDAVAVDRILVILPHVPVFRIGFLAEVVPQINRDTVILASVHRVLLFLPEGSASFSAA